MAYRHSSNMNGDLAEIIAKSDIMSKGWIVLSPECRDTVYDFAVQLHESIVKVQVKALTSSGSFKTTNRSIGAKESVSDGGKRRNCYKYSDFHIDWIAGVDVQSRSVHYYPIDVYRNYTSINVCKVGSCEFPINDNIQNHAKVNIPIQPKRVLF